MLLLRLAEIAEIIRLSWGARMQPLDSMEVGMSEQKWSIERIHKEVAEARTKVFVITKVLETVDLKPAEHSEWVLLIRPLLKDLIQNAERIGTLLEEPESPAKD